MKQKEFYKLLESLQGASKEEVLEAAKMVASTGDPYLICDFCEFVEAADCPEIMPIMQSAIMQNENPLHWYEFAYLMGDLGRKYVDFEALTKRFVALKDPKILYYCREYVPALDSVELDKAMALCGNLRWMKAYLDIFKGSDQEKYEKYYDYYGLKGRLEECEMLKERGYGIRPEAIKRRVFADPVFGLFDAYKLAVATREAYYSVCFLENYPTLDDDHKIARHIFELGDILSIYEYGASCEGAMVGKVEKAAEQSELPKYMFYVAAYCPGADAKKMLKGIKKCRGVPDFIKNKYAGLLQEHIEQEEMGE